MYSPRAPVKEIIDRAWEHIQSVPYKVSIRWVFYKLLQEGYFSKKSDYNRLKSYLSQARKRYYRDWRPDTLADETRQPIYRGLGYQDEKAVVDHLPDVAEKIDTQISHFYRQEFYVEIWFEAKAMAGQFLHYTHGLILRPFGGDPSIPYKYRAAQEIDYLCEYFGMPPVVILYFGDYDEKGLKILDSAMEDIYQWSETDFEYRRCGLTLEQAEMFGIPENPDKPGEYQWEALDDEQAGTLIREATERYLDMDLILEAEEEAQELKAKYEPIVREKLKDIDR